MLVLDHCGNLSPIERSAMISGNRRRA